MNNNEEQQSDFLENFISGFIFFFAIIFSLPWFIKEGFVFESSKRGTPMEKSFSFLYFLLFSVLIILAINGTIHIPGPSRYWGGFVLAGMIFLGVWAFVSRNSRQQKPTWGSATTGILSGGIIWLVFHWSGVW